MAQKRMIDKKISVSEQVANLPIEAQLIFTWAIPHADDVGLLPYSIRTLKAIIIPMLDITLPNFEKFWKQIVEAKDPSGTQLISEFSYSNEKFWRIAKFFDIQRLRKDLQPYTILPIRLEESPAKNWDKILSIPGLEQVGYESVTGSVRGRNENEPEVKGSKEKISKEKKDYCSAVLSAWNEQGIVTHKTISNDAQKELDKLVAKKYPLEDLLKAIKLYGTILNGKEYFWTYKWNLYEFLKRGLMKFEGKTPDDYRGREERKSKSVDKL